MDKIYHFSLYLNRKWKIRRRAAFLICTVLASMAAGCLIMTLIAAVIGAGAEDTAEMVVTGTLYSGMVFGFFGGIIYLMRKT